MIVLLFFIVYVAGLAALVLATHVERRRERIDYERALRDFDALNRGEITLEEYRCGGRC